MSFEVSGTMTHHSGIKKADYYGCLFLTFWLEQWNIATNRWAKKGVGKDTVLAEGYPCFSILFQPLSKENCFSFWSAALHSRIPIIFTPISLYWPKTCRAVAGVHCGSVNQHWKRILRYGIHSWLFASAKDSLLNLGDKKKYSRL